MVEAMVEDMVEGMVEDIVVDMEADKVADMVVEEDKVAVLKVQVVSLMLSVKHRICSVRSKV